MAKDAQPVRNERMQEQELITKKADVVDSTRNDLARLARTLPQPEGVQAERFEA